ncbi:MAG: hypothetical protein HW421_2558 [Ignavibacteria bacterium]|nr:hypothetical protein [Ignavibacteria bacterium]
MKKIGILQGMEHSFTEAVCDRINAMKIRGVIAENIRIGALKMNHPNDYAIIFDRASHEVPFYRSFLKNAAVNDVKIVNNPFVICVDDYYFHASLAKKLGFEVPRTVVVPSKEHPPGATADSMRNLIFPLNWEEVFSYVGFPAHIKPNHGNGTYHTFKVYNSHEFFSTYDLTGNNVIILQQDIDYDDYFKCYVIGQKHVRIMKYDPSMPQHLRYLPEVLKIDPALADLLIDTSIKISTALGLDFNTVEFAIRGGKPYIIEFRNNVPNAEKAFLHEENFNWLVATTADYLISLTSVKGPQPFKFVWDFADNKKESETETNKNEKPKLKDKQSNITFEKTFKKKGRPAKLKIEQKDIDKPDVEIKIAKRGRKPGSKNKPKPVSPTVELPAPEKIIIPVFSEVVQISTEKIDTPEIVRVNKLVKKKIIIPAYSMVEREVPEQTNKNEGSNEETYEWVAKKNKRPLRLK